MLKRCLWLIVLACLVLGFVEGKGIFAMDNRPAPESAVHADGWTPAWAKGIVWYQIFPERFRNGDPSNDPKLKDIDGSWPHDGTSPWQVHPWTSDWYELQPYEKQNGKDIWFNLQRRRYGGDLAGITEKLDYLQDLGVGAIYLNPVFASPSLHKYDSIVYHHVDPNFGPDPEGDRKLMAGEIPDDPSTWVWTKADRQMLALIREVHKRKMRIIFDGVFNHIGMKSPFFLDLVKNQQKSGYRDWFIVKSWDDPAAGTKFDYEGWVGVKELPEWREDEKGIVAGPRKYIFEITRRWMDPDGDGDPSDGIDGWRLDVAYCVKHPFWKDWVSLVRKINPQAYTTAEIVDTVEANKPYLQGDEFSAVMNYNFAFACSEFFVDEKNRISATRFDRLLQELREAYHPCVAHVMQNLYDSHDTSRLGTHVLNRDKGSYRDWGKYFDISKGSNPAYSTRKPGPGDLEVQKLFVVFQMTYLGAPMIYYGDEAGMWGGNDPCCRKPMVWDDLKYSDEVFLPGGSRMDPPDKVEFNWDLYLHYKKLIGIRNSHQAIKTGDYKTLLADDRTGLFAFSRSGGGEYIVVVINNSRTEQPFAVKVEKQGQYVDLLSRDDFFETEEDGTAGGIIGPRGARILLAR